MGFESLIPFGLETETGQLVDVGSVKRGNTCGCICPSCNTPLVARHGDINEWHFAHRSQKVHNQTGKECEYSFAVSVRLMIRQLFIHGLKLKTPRLECLLSEFSESSCERDNFSYVVTEESLLCLEDVRVGANFCGVTVDILGFVEGVPFVVFVTYKDRALPSELKIPSSTKCGVIEFNINAMSRLFKQEQSGHYKEVLRRYIENETEGKSWAYHPREQKLKEAAIAKHQSWLLQQEIAAKTNRHLFQQSIEPMKSNSSSSVKSNTRTFTCVMCKSTWTGTSMICRTCDTHLFTTEK